MPSTSTCNKCRRGVAVEGDTWCLGCSSLDHSQELFRNSWTLPAVRAIAEEAALSSARYIRALSGLDRSLAAKDRAQLVANKSTAPKAAPPRAHRSRSREPASGSRFAERSQPAAREEPARESRQELPTGDSYEYTESGGAPLTTHRISSNHA